MDAIASRVEDEWGEGTILRVIAPSVAGDARVVTFWRRFERMSATPNAAAALFRWNAEIDLRSRPIRLLSCQVRAVAEETAARDAFVRRILVPLTYETESPDPAFQKP